MATTVDLRYYATHVAAIALMVLVPLALVLWANRRLGVSWRVIGIGALAFALSQLLTRIPAIQVIQYLLREPLAQSAWLMHAWLAFAALTAGLAEETARLIAFARPLKAARRFEDAVGFGLGHGGLESALLVGGLSIIGLINVVVLSNLDPASVGLAGDELAKLEAAQASIATLVWWHPLLGAYERLGAMVLHVFLTVLVLQRFVRGQRRWYWFAVALHAGANWAVLMVMQRHGAVAAELALTVVAALCLAGLVALRRSMASPGPPSGAAPA
jgi:uncharacterized membrane protein YhfC